MKAYNIECGGYNPSAKPYYSNLGRLQGTRFSHEIKDNYAKILLFRDFSKFAVILNFKYDNTKDEFEVPKALTTAAVKIGSDAFGFDIEKLNTVDIPDQLLMGLHSILDLPHSGCEGPCPILIL